ncbi:hypothetical protein [Photobacterium toruni]|uniref:hypothetical protein n=1 Tax=Photobacterium toruni TaxID=1935446 RepID=UPI002110DEDC|nr:hypothetical protein [Photobacterium toruni]
MSIATIYMLLALSMSFICLINLSKKAHTGKHGELTASVKSPLIKLGMILITLGTAIFMGVFWPLVTVNWLKKKGVNNEL